MRDESTDQGDFQGGDYHLKIPARSHGQRMHRREKQNDNDRN